MSLIVWDSGPLISLGDNCLSGIIEKLSEKHDLIITKGVVDEIVNHPFTTKKFKLKALQLKKLIDKGVIRVVEKKGIKEQAENVMNLTNSLLEYKGKKIKIVQRGEAESVAAYKILKADALVIDERTTRHLIEDPIKVKEYMQSRTGFKVKMNENVFKEIKKELKDINVLRSAEIVAFAYEKGLMKECMLKPCLEAALYAVKFSGCSITKEEISEYIKML